jgi:O-antigen/teichoic acid export membrane protein
MWAAPFAVALALFAGDLVHYVLGDHWKQVTGLLVAFGLICGLSQVAFNWDVFLRAVNHTKPLFVAAVLQLAVFVGVAVPAMILLGVAGYAIAFAASTVVQIGIRSWYMRQLFRGFNVVRQMTRAIAPTLPPAALVLLVRAVESGARTAPQVVFELILYWTAAVAATWLFERALVGELLGYLLGRRTRSPLPTVASPLPGEASSA